MQKIYLKKDEERRLLAGHLWLYSNEIDTQKSPLAQYVQGELVEIHSQHGKKLGIGYINPHALICVRLLSRNCQEEINVDFFVQRIKQSLVLRERYFIEPYYRLIFADSDWLPGLIVDRYGDVLVVQINTVGMESLKDLIIQALCDVVKPNGILWRNDSSVREQEGLDKYVEVAYGKVPQQIIIEEHGCKFSIPLWQGQKTGWFFDQSNNRSRLPCYVKNAKVLDVFSYIGAWAILAAKQGAQQVTCVEVSDFASSCLQENAKLNNVADKINVICEDAFVALKQMASQEQLFDVIIVDPPAFIKRRKDIKEGFLAYLRLHELALQLLSSQGILFTTSCSMHMQRDMLLDAIRKAALKTKHNMQILEQLHQAQDHPIHLAISETDYLKGFVVAGCVQRGFL